MKLPRAKCPTCGGVVAVRKAGELREHFQKNHAMFGTGTAKQGTVPICAGSGKWGELIIDPSPTTPGPATRSESR